MTETCTEKGVCADSQRNTNNGLDENVKGNRLAVLLWHGDRDMHKKQRDRRDKIDRLSDTDKKGGGRRYAR